MRTTLFAPKIGGAALSAALLSVSLLVPAGAARAQLIIGSGGLENVFPFEASYIGEYQEVYASSAFPGPVLITQIAFASRGSGGTFSFNETLGLGTTAATPAAPGNNYAANKGPDFTTVFNGTVTPTLTGAGNTFDLIFNLTTPFAYNPANGNLLLDVVNNSSNYGDGFDLGQAEPNIGRIFNLSGNGAPTPGANEGLRTRFTLGAAAAPEPASLSLIALVAFAGVARMRRRG